MKNFIIGFLIFFTNASMAKSDMITSGFIQIRRDQRLYVEYKKAAPGKPTLVLANGLTYSTRQWNDFADAVERLDPGVGLVLYDMEGQGQTLLDKAPITFDIPMEHQVRDLRDLMLTLNIPGPVSLVGLSYGGGVALYYASVFPDDFDHYIVLAPFIERLESQDKIINNWIRYHRSLHPWDGRSDDELYDWYLRALVTTTYPTAEPIILENPFKLEGVFRMVKGAKHWQAIDKANDLPRRKIHVVAAEKDEHVKLPRLNLLVDAYKDSALASYMILEGSRHKIPETEPEFSAAWALLIANEHPLLKTGNTFRGNPINGEARSATHVLKVVPKVGSCESELRNSPEPR